MIRHFQAGDGRASWQARLGDGAGLVGDKTLQRQCEKMETSSPGITGPEHQLYLYLFVYLYLYLYLNLYHRSGKGWGAPTVGIPEPSKDSQVHI